MYADILHNRKLPKLQNRDEMLWILQEEEYGHLPVAPKEISWAVQNDIIPLFCANKATYSQVILQYTLENGNRGAFPVACVIPKKPGKHPFFIHINFRPDVPDRYMPTEELIDNGFAVLSFCYEDVTKDNDDWTDGLAGALYPEGRRKPNDPGKIAMWAWAVQRVMDYAQTLDALDLNNAIVCGHSRLGKTALLAAATDERFSFAHSNDSGCAGAAVTRGKSGETVADICMRFPYWFCENYLKYANAEHTMPFDQHYLLGSIAPRYVSVGSAHKDGWADPESEFLCCIAASPAYERYNIDGFVYDGRQLDSETVYTNGSIGYYQRPGTHYFSREDWHRLIDFIRMHKK